MSNDAVPEYDPVSGYPSPAEGAEQAGETPAPSTETTRHEPGPDHPRFNEVYRQKKEAEREAEQLRQQVTDLQMQQQFVPEVPAPVVPEQPAQDDEWGDFFDRQRAEMEKVMAPLRDRMDAQEKLQQNQRVISAFETAHPEYDKGRDGATIVAAMNKYGTNNPEAAYRIAFPERVIGASQQEPSAPVADVRSVGQHVPSDSPEALMQRFNTPGVSEQEKADIAARISNLGGYGSSSVEKALGL